jgi:hypothetical protein
MLEKVPDNLPTGGGRNDQGVNNRTVGTMLMQKILLLS